MQEFNYINHQFNALLPYGWDSDKNGSFMVQFHSDREGGASLTHNITITKEQLRAIYKILGGV